MKQFKKILFINDFQKEKTPALERALKLAKENNASIKLIEVLEEFSFEIQSAGPSSGLMDYRKAVEEESIHTLRELIILLKEEGIQATGEVFWGTPFIEIIREVLRNSHDLVMLCPRQIGKIKSLLFGSRIMHLMRKCPCPVWAVNPSERKHYNKIMAAIDPAPMNDRRNLLNIKIMELATSLAHLEQSELHIISCRKPIFGGPLWHGSTLSQDALGTMNQEMGNACREWLEALLEKFDLLEALIETSDAEDLSCRVHLLDGEPDELIPEAANSEAVDLVVMGTVSRTGISGFFIGNTAERILQKLDCSVLAVKPDGFETPVKMEG